MDHFRDPVHGFIRVNETERAVVDTAAVQRLRGVKQLALGNLVYHGAEHTRFGHALGAMELAGRIFDTLAEKRAATPRGPLGEGAEGLARNRQLVRLAGLLHDVGHPPFSHASEEFFARGESHVEMGLRLIRADPVRTALESGPEARALGVRAEDVAAVIAGTGGPPLLHEIVSGDLDADRMDYLLRDSLYTGVAYGVFDHARLVQTLTVSEQDGRPVLALEEGGLHAAEGLLLARYFMFTQVYFHRVKRAYDLHLRDFLRELFADPAGPGKYYPTDPAKFLEWDDAKVFLLMRERASRSDPARRILGRDHFRTVFETSGHADAKETARLDAAVAALRARLPGVPVLTDSSETAPHGFRHGRFLVQGRTGGATPIEKASPVLADLRLIVQKRVYVPREREAEARKVLEGV
ncbi:MAG: HD domain-containing protein [Planctomycetales bacterium]|nr:HD domain-containing protein [Planctomycetales bacterium]